MKRVCPFVVAAVIAGMPVLLTPSPAVGCGMGHGGGAYAPPEQSQRVEDLRAKLRANTAALAASQDQAQMLELLKQRTELQDALLAETMPAQGSSSEPRSGTHQH